MRCSGWSRFSWRIVLASLLLNLMAVYAVIAAATGHLPGYPWVVSLLPSSRVPVGVHARKTKEERHRLLNLVLYEGKERGPIRCRLTPFSAPAHGEDCNKDVKLELINTSDRPVTIWGGFPMGPFHHVTFLVRDRSGNVVREYTPARSDARDMLIDPKTHRPTGDVPIITLAPGEVRAQLFILSVREHKLPGPHLPASSQVEAVFWYEDCGGFPSPGQNMLARSQRLDREEPADD
jgi:hypothetical protein